MSYRIRLLKNAACADWCGCAGDILSVSAQMAQELVSIQSAEAIDTLPAVEPQIETEPASTDAGESDPEAPKATKRSKRG